MVEFNDRRGEGRLLRAEDKLKKKGPRITKAQYEKHLEESGQEEVRMADVRMRGGGTQSMTGDEYEKWAASQPKGSHRATYRTVVRKKKT